MPAADEVAATREEELDSSIEEVAGGKGAELVSTAGAGAEDIVENVEAATRAGAGTSEEKSVTTAGGGATEELEVSEKLISELVAASGGGAIEEVAAGGGDAIEDDVTSE